MTDIVLRDIDPALATRLRALAESRNWTMHETLLNAVELGLRRCEAGELQAELDGDEAQLLKAAIDALEQVPNDPGFAKIGQGAPPAPRRPDGPAQTVDEKWTREEADADADASAAAADGPAPRDTRGKGKGRQDEDEGATRTLF
jgi:hypothetical protein